MTVLQSWRARASRFMAARLDRESELGLRLTSALGVLSLAIWAFSGLLDAVLDNEWLVRLDRAVELWFHAHATRPALAVFDAVTQLGSPVVVALVVVVAAYLWWRREWMLLWLWLAANAGGKAVQMVLKASVHRDRPQYAAAYLRGHSYSFPSGHTMGATICYTMLAYVLSVLKPGTAARTRVLYVVAGITIVAVGFSRLYLGVHYPSDVLGGLAAGAAWVTACLSVLDVVRAHRRPTRRNNDQAV